MHINIMDIQIIVHTPYSEYIGEVINGVTNEEYENIKKMTLEFLINGNEAYEMMCENNSYVIIPPTVIKESSIIIKIID